MDYTRIHNSLIINTLEQSPIQRIVRRGENDYRLSGGTVIYVERHHIIPKSLGGDDSPSNIVEVLPEEHLLLHQLRYKIYKNVVDIRAVHFMIGNFSKNVLGKSKLKLYSYYRQEYSNMCSGENHPMFGRHHSYHTRQKLSEFRQGKLYAKNVNTGEYVGLVNNTHPKIKTGEWAHISKGIQNANKGRNQQQDRNSNWSGYTDNEIIKHAANLYIRNGGWNRNDWFRYCKSAHPPIPKHYNSECRFSGVEGTGTYRFQHKLKQRLQIDKLKMVRI